MSGTLPGVEVARRRRASHHQHTVGTKPCPRPLDRNAYSPSGLMTGGYFLDEKTLRARRSLEEKLRNLKPSSKRGWSRIFCLGDRTTMAELVHATDRREPVSGTSDSEICRSITLSSQVGAERDVCSVCLDGFQLHQSVVYLPCFHRYHTGCLRPWLSAHSQCPYCRAQISSVVC